MSGIAGSPPPDDDAARADDAAAAGDDTAHATPPSPFADHGSGGPAGGGQTDAGQPGGGPTGGAPAGGVPAPPPYPGWSPQQPGGPRGEPSGTPGGSTPGGSTPGAGQQGWDGGGWGPGGDQPRGTQGWQRPSAGGEGGWDRPGGPTYGGPPGAGGQNGSGGQSGPGAPGGYGPGGPGGYGAPRPGQPGYGQQGYGQGYGAWSSGPGSAWQAPDVKPGVIPLRPLGVTEILDGAITTIRRNLAAMLGLSAIVAAATQILSSGLLAWVFGEAITEPDLGLSDAEALDVLARGLPAALIGWLVTVIATVFLTGVLTVVVGRAVLGRELSIGEAWRESKGRLPRLLGLTLLYTLIYFGPAIVVLLLAVLLAATGGVAAAVLVGLAGLAAIPVTIWLYVRYALATPALMLETTTTADGVTRPIRVVESLRRSASLVRTSWWRAFAILLLILFITLLIGQVVAVPFGVPSMLGTNAADDPVAWYVLNTLAGMISATITAPFAAAATALLYIDRRIRREGLDIELARAAGVDLQGRGGSGPPPGSS